MRNIDKENLEKLIKIYKPLKHSNIDKIEEELIKIYETLELSGKNSNKNSYNFHRVPIKGINYLVADAKYLNTITNQSRRGKIRYIFNIKDKKLIGIAYEQDNGKYKKIV